MVALQLRYIVEDSPMKTATLPALRVDPKLREAAERALRPDETLSRLMEAALENYIAQREAEDDFIARGLRSARDARQHERYVTAASVVGKLEKKLAAARKSSKSS
jgi:predicted transcriptional regulator